MRLHHVSGILALTVLTSALSADLITIVHEGTGSGSINGKPFTDKAFVITSKADTFNRQGFPGVWWLDHDTSSIKIQDVGEFTFTTGTRTFVNNAGIVGFSRAGGGGNDLYNGPFDSAFQTWDMTTAVGPVSNDTGSLLQWGLEPFVMTNEGQLIFNDQPGIHVTFTASVGNACYPDCDGDSNLTIDDFICFQTLFALGDPYADCDGDTGLTIDDFICFQTLFAIGC